MSHPRIFQINTSLGGVPKTAVRQASVTLDGIVTDRQAHPKVHGGVDRALCLYSVERIQALQAEGHPIYPGAIGENVTISGLDWSQIVPGVKLALGNDVIIEIASFATPCNQIRESFMWQKYNRISHKQHPGWARVYARIVQQGQLRVGDAVRLLLNE